MSEDEWVRLADVPDVADERWLYAVGNGVEPNPAAKGADIQVVPLAEFVSVEEETAEALLGTREETLLPANGMLLMYGDGGAGKTTLTVDAVCHLGSARSWLGLEVARPVRVLLIENEGPRGKFRQVLGEKVAGWNGELGQMVHVLEEPWTRFTLQEEGHREGLARQIRELRSEVVVMGPLATLGMIGGGTPDEVSAFEKLLRQTRALLREPCAFWIVHHENKSGDVSGAWERVPDTLCHVQAAGNGHTRLVWRKARWSSEHHGKSLELVWGEGRSFSLVEKKTRDPWEEMVVAYTHANSWRTVKESAKLISISEADAKKVLAELVRRGEMEYEQGPPGRHGNAHCYRLKSALVDLAHLSADSSIPPSEGALEYSPLPFREGGTQRRLAEQGEKSAQTASAPSAHTSEEADVDDGIPF